MLFCLRLVHALTVLMVTGATDKWFCPKSECQKCSDEACPADIALFENKEQCDQHCPKKPDCYLCRNDNCVPAFDMGCYGPDAIHYTSMNQCLSICGSGAGIGPQQPPIHPPSPPEPEPPQTQRPPVISPAEKSATSISGQILSILLLLPTSYIISNVLSK